MLRVGDRAPRFEARDSQGNLFRLDDQVGKKNVILFFYPRAFTPGCTAEVCSFRDAYDEFQRSDTQVVGVSTDDLDTQERFAGAHRLPFPLLGDPDKHIANSYGVLGALRSLFGFAKRATFVIDKQGIIRGIFHHELAIERHLADVRSTLSSLSLTCLPSGPSPRSRPRCWATPASAPRQRGGGWRSATTPRRSACSTTARAGSRAWRSIATTPTPWRISRRPRQPRPPPRSPPRWSGRASGGFTASSAPGRPTRWPTPGATTWRRATRWRATRPPSP